MLNLKRFISVMLIFCLMFTNFPTNVFAEELKNKEHWADEMITDFFENGYLDTTANYDDEITRGKFISLIFNVMDVKSMDYKSVFSDVSKDDEYADEIITLYKLGWIDGYPDGTFKPNDIITRYEAATVIFNLLELVEYDENVFEDRDSIPDWVRNKLNALFNIGYFTGYPDGTFKGERVMLLSEAVAFLFRSADDLKSYAKENEKKDTPKTSRNRGSSSGSDGGNITPSDTTPPSIMSISDADIVVSNISSWEAPTTIATDDIDGNVPVSIIYSSDDIGSNVTNLASARIHLNTPNHTVRVTYSASDNSGNTASIFADFTSTDNEIGYSGRVYTASEISSNPSPDPNLDNFDVTNIMPNHGTLGTYVTIKGQSFTEDYNDFKVYFEGVTQGKVEAQIVEYKNGEVVVISPIMETEHYEVYIETKSITSHKFDFTGEALIVDEATKSARTLINDTKELIDSTIHEIQIAYTPEINGALSGELIDSLDKLKTDLDDLLVELDNADPDVLNIFNQLMATEALLKQKTDIDFATELLSHSTASESLDNINTAIRTIKEVHSTLKTARSWMRSIGIALIATGTICSIFTFGASGTLIALGKSILGFCESILTPVISTLTGIIFVLDCAPSYAVGDSFETSIVSDNYGINEGFSSLRAILGERSSTNDLYETALKLRSSTIQLKTNVQALYNPIEAFGVDEELLATIDNDDTLKALYADMKNAKNDACALSQTMNNITLESDINDYLTEINIYISLVEADPVTVYTNRDDYRDIFDSSDEIVQDIRELSKYIKTRIIDILYPELLFSNNLRQWTDTVLDNQTNDFEARNMLIENLYNENKNPDIFTQIEILPAEILDTDAGVIYVGRDMYIKGTMDFEDDTNTGLVVDEISGTVMPSFSNPIASGVEFMLSGAISWFVEDVIGEALDLDIDLTDVDVKLKLESEDENIISGHWDGDKLIVTGHKPGIVKVRVIADIEQVTGPSAKIPIESASITRTYIVMSGTQTTPPFSHGPRIDKLTNLETLEQNPLSIDAYLGDKIKISGYGFSNNITNHQNIYFPEVGNYNSTGMLEKRFVNAYGHEEITLEVPDTVDGDFYIVVGEDQDDTPVNIEDKTFNSNLVSINIKNNELDNTPPSAIIGEILKVSGKGFSHYGNNNKIEFLDQSDNNIRLGIASTITQENNIVGNIHNTNDSINGFGGAVNCDYHEELIFQVPNLDKDTLYDLGVNTLNNRFLTNVKPVVVRGFSDNVTLDEKTLRGDIAINETNSDMLSVYMDLSDDNGFMLMGAFADGITGDFKEVTAISNNIGGIETAPDEPYADYNLGTYGVTWIGKDNNSFDDVFVSFSSDGKVFSSEINLSSSNNVSTQPKIKLSDIDGDNDADAVIVYTENGSNESENTSIKLAVLENKGNDFVSRGIYTISQGDACEPSIDIIDNHLVIAYSEAHSVGSTQTYERLIKGYETDIDDSFTSTNICRYEVSNKKGSFNYYQDRANTTTKLYTSANYPDVAMYKDGEDYKTYYVWDQIYGKSNSNYAFELEDIYYAHYINASEVIEPKNVADLERQSQSPKISVDNDGTISLAFINIGMSKQSYDPQGYSSYVYFTRSLDDGETFGVPYMQLDNHGRRIGHINLESYGSGNNTIVYQKHDSVDNPTINIISTHEYDYDENNLDNKDENTRTKKLNEYIIRTYNDKTISSIPLVPYKFPTGDIVISEISGKNSRKIVRNNSTIGKVSSTHDGKYLYYTQQWLVESEADGSHPIRVALGEWEQGYIGTNISSNDKYVTVTGYGEMIGTGGLMTIDLLKGYSSFMGTPYGVASDSMWATDGSNDYNINCTPRSWWSSYETTDFSFGMYNTPATEGDIWPAVTTTGGAIAYLDTDMPDTSGSNGYWDYMDFGKYNVMGDLMLRIKDSEDADINVDTNSSMIAFGKNSDLMAYIKEVNGKRELRLINIYDTDTKVNIIGSGNIFNPMFVSNNNNLIYNDYVNGDVILKGVPITSTSPVSISIGGNISPTTGVSGKAGLLTIEDVQSQVSPPQPQTEIINIEISPDMVASSQSVSVNEGESLTVNVSLTEAPDKCFVYVKITELNNDQFYDEGSYGPPLTYTSHYFVDDNYNVPKSFILTNVDDKKQRGNVTGNVIFEVTTTGELYKNVGNQTIDLTAIDND